MPCARTGLPLAPANHTPDSSIQSMGADELVRTPYSIRYGAPPGSRASGDAASASERIDRTGSISLENSVPLASAAAGMSGKTELGWSLHAITSAAMSHTKAAWPSDARTVSYTHLRAHETGRNLVCR